jgi:hypothetical protein
LANEADAVKSGAGRDAPSFRSEQRGGPPQRDLGNIIGMSRESTNKQLRIWQGKKWVWLERNAVVILATDSLAAIGELGAHSA